MRVISATHRKPRVRLCQTKETENKTFVAHKGSINISVTASTRQCALVTKLTPLCSRREQNKTSTVQRETLTTETQRQNRKTNVILGRAMNKLILQHKSCTFLLTPLGFTGLMKTTDWESLVKNGPGSSSSTALKSFLLHNIYDNFSFFAASEPKFHMFDDNSDNRKHAKYQFDNWPGRWSIIGQPLHISNVITLITLISDTLSLHVVASCRSSPCLTEDINRCFLSLQSVHILTPPWFSLSSSRSPWWRAVILCRCHLTTRRAARSSSWIHIFHLYLMIYMYQKVRHCNLSVLYTQQLLHTRQRDPSSVGRVSGQRTSDWKAPLRHCDLWFWALLIKLTWWFGDFHF